MERLLQRRLDRRHAHSFLFRDFRRESATQLWEFLPQGLIDRVAETCGNAIQRRNRFVGGKVVFEDFLHARWLADRLCSASAPPVAATRSAMIHNDLPT